MTQTTFTSRTIQVAPGRILKPSPVFDTYWRFAAKRQEVFMRRAAGVPWPWTDDPILANHRFTNAYRASDRVSQYLIRHVLYEGDQHECEIFFRALLFKFFNRIETWEALVREIGVPTWGGFDPERTAQVLDAMLDRGETIYSAAYIMPSPSFGSPRKHRNHLRLLEHMMRDGAPHQSLGAKSLQQAFEILRGYPSLGGFLAFQFTIDLNYSRLIDFSEMDFVVAGPGARDGIRKCFVDTAGLSDADVIRAVAERAEKEFGRLGLAFKDLWGRPLQLIDCQNLFCEVDKYARVAHPEAKGESGRTRIKQKFTAGLGPLPQCVPPNGSSGSPWDSTAGHPAEASASAAVLGIEFGMGPCHPDSGGRQNQARGCGRADRDDRDGNAPIHHVPWGLDVAVGQRSITRPAFLSRAPSAPSNTINLPPSEVTGRDFKRSSDIPSPSPHLFRPRRPRLQELCVVQPCISAAAWSRRSRLRADSAPSTRSRFW